MKNIKDKKTEADLDNLLLISTCLKVFTVLAMLLLMIFNNILEISENLILFSKKRCTNLSLAAEAMRRVSGEN